MDPSEYKVVYTIRIRLIKRQNVVVGSKITSRFLKEVSAICEYC